MVCVCVVGCGEWCGVGCRDGVCGCGGVWGVEWGRIVGMVCVCGGVWGVVWGRVSGWCVCVWWGVGSGVG